MLKRVRWRVKLQIDLSEHLATRKGLRKDDALAFMLLHISLEKDNIWDSGIKRSGTMYYK
jgi:hypothetical protein